MVQPKEGQLGTITILDEDSGGSVTATGANIQDVSGVTHTSLGGTPGNDSFWIETGAPSLPKFTDSDNITVTLGAGTGDVVGPGISIDNSIVVFDGTTGKLVKDSSFTLPGSDGTNGQVLSTDGSGNLTFITAGTPDLPDRSIQFNNAGGFGGDAEFVYTVSGSDNYIDLSNTTSDGSTGLRIFDETATQSMGFLYDDSTSTGIVTTFASANLEVSGSNNLVLSANSSLILDGGTPLTWAGSDGTNGQALTTDGSGNLSFTTVASPSTGPVVGTVVNTDATTIVNASSVGHRIIPVDSSGGALSISLPITPLDGETITIKDWGGTSGTDQITILRNGSNIDNVGADDTLGDDGGAISYTWDATLSSWISY